MASEEQVDITIKLHADTAEAKQVSDAIKDAQQSATQTQQTFQSTTQNYRPPPNDPSIAARQQEILRMLQEPGASIGRVGGGAPPGGPPGGPPLIPPDTAVKLNAAKDALGGVKKEVLETGSAGGISTLSMLRFTGALFGVGVGFSIFRAAGAELHQFFETLIGDSVKAAQAVQDNTIIYGQNAAAFQEWASTISQQAGVAETELIQAGNAAQQFGRQIGFSDVQTRGLEAAATLMARIKGIGVDQAMTSLQQAIEGNAQAAQSLNLQLDAGYIAFTQMNGATAEAFAELGSGEQEWLRYESALEQTAKQASATVPSLTDLRKAQQDLNKEWNDFVNNAGPGILTLLSGIVGGAAAAAKAIADLNAATVQRNQEGGMQDPGFKNELALLDQVKAKLGDLADTDAGKAVVGQLDAMRQKITEIDAASSDPGFRNDLGAALPVLDAAKQKVDEFGNAVVKKLDLDPGNKVQQSLMGAADQADRASGFFQTMAEHYQKIADLAPLLAAGNQVLLADLANENVAAQRLVDLRSQQLSLTADEARIKLEMLPTQQALTEAQNQAAQAQLRAQQATLPATRAQQDLQDQIRLYTLIAQSPDRGMQERQTALARATALTRRTSETDITAVTAQIGARPAERAAEDIANAQRAQALQLAQALLPDEYAKQQNDLLTQIATAAKDAAHRAFEITIQGITLVYQGSGVGELNDTDKTAIINLVGQGVWDAFHAAVVSQNKTGASSALIGAIQTS